MSRVSCRRPRCPDVRDVGLDVRLRPRAGAAAIQAVIAHMGILPLGRHQIHIVAIDLDVDGDVLALWRVSKGRQPVEQLFVYLLQRFSRLLGE